MKKLIAVVALVLFVAGTVTVYAEGGSACQTTSSKESGWQEVYDNISNWGKGTAQPSTKAPAPEKVETKKGTEPTAKN